MASLLGIYGNSLSPTIVYSQINTLESSRINVRLSRSPLSSSKGCLISPQTVAFSNGYFVAFELLIDKTKHPYRNILADSVLDVIFYDISLIRLPKLLSFLIAATDLKSNVANLKV